MLQELAAALHLIQQLIMKEQIILPIPKQQLALVLLVILEPLVLVVLLRLGVLSMI